MKSTLFILFLFSSFIFAEDAFDESMSFVLSTLEKSDFILHKLSPTSPTCQDVTIDPISNYENHPKVMQMLVSLKKGVSECRFDLPRRKKLKKLIRNKICECEKNNDGSDNYNKCTKSSRTSIDSCYRYVKLGIVDATLAPYLWGLGAIEAVDVLPHHGFINLLEMEEYKFMNSENAPFGAILVYEGGRYGHIEVKAGSREFISDFISEKPIDAYNKRRKLKGIFIHPNLK